MGDSAKVGGVILAGGQSRRIGRNKSFIELGGQKLIERVVSAYRQLFEEITIVTNSPGQYEYLGLKLVTDAHPAKGSLVGIYTGLVKTSADRCFIAACDMPFLNASLIAHMVAVSAGSDVLVARLSQGQEPLHAIYSKACIEPIEELLAKGDLKIINFFPKVKVVEMPEQEVRRFDPDLLSFFNINNDADLKRAGEVLSPLKGPTCRALFDF